MEKINKKFEVNENGVGGRGAGLHNLGGQKLSWMPVKIRRFFTSEGKNPFKYDIYGNPLEWVSENVNVTDDAGKIIYTQPNVKRPSFWSELAIKVVASKYFWGNQDKSERENSVEMLINRIVKFIERQALRQKYCDEENAKILSEELAAICLNQMCVFNSPVWFNAGIQEYDVNSGGVSYYKWDGEKNSVARAEKSEDSPQCSACFIQSVKDDMDSIMEVQVAEANLFKSGSGTGTNRSSLRSSKERLTGGGTASGPLSFMRGYDAYAGIIKSGGKTRRAAKMEILNAEHPDIVEFIESKQKEEKKAWALIAQGFSGGLNGEAYGTIAFQNCNMSVRASDNFMEAVKRDGEWKTKYVTNGKTHEVFRAREILKKIAEGTHICGDPGMQFDTTINKWNTCKNSGRINASNPCSEYMFLDDSACNLASINLLRFLDEGGKFDVEKFKKVVRAYIVCMDLIVDGGSYPTEKITQNSHDFRALGLGYANLGALLMSLGLAYDSEAGRAVAASVSAIITGEAYKTSAELAALIKPFEKYEENKISMREVVRMHRDEVKKIDVEAMPEELRYLVNDAWDCWTDAFELGEKHGYRNAQVTVLAPTGTIAFFMDCDTTGIEPDIALVKYKNLAGGGMLKIVNRSVARGLKTLGYDDEEIKKILEYVENNDMIEGAPFLKDEHLAVFDCAFKPAKGKRAIDFRGHVKMMGAVQPFISGAISKTINMSEDSSVKDIEDAYVFAWECGLKAVAIYRENSKKAQPLNTRKELEKKEITRLGERKKLPQTRRSITHKFEIAGHEGYLTVGLYDNGNPGEIFVTMHKQGSTIRGLMDAWATSVSINLQYGASVNDVFGRFRFQKFEPAGFVKNTNGGSIDGTINPIRSATSIVDYVAQFMLTNFGEGAGGIEFNVGKEIEEEQASLLTFENEGLTCPLCGGPAKRIGNCAIRCTSCNQVVRSGCGE